MTRVESLEAEIQKLSQTEFAQLREWVLEEDWNQWDRQIEKDASSGKLDDLFARALGAHRARQGAEERGGQSPKATA